MVIEWRPIIISILFTLAIFVVSLLASLSSLALLGVLLGGVVVGVMIGGEWKDGLLLQFLGGVWLYGPFGFVADAENQQPHGHQCTGIDTFRS